MTREEAIRNLKYFSLCGAYHQLIHMNDTDSEAISMAIKALEQPEQKIGKFVRWMEKRETPKYISYTPHCKCSLCGNELFIENINYCYMCGARLVEDRGAERREE